MLLSFSHRDSPHHGEDDAESLGIIELLCLRDDVEYIREQNRRVRDDGAAGHATRSVAVAVEAAAI